MYPTRIEAEQNYIRDILKQSVILIKQPNSNLKQVMTTQNQTDGTSAATTGEKIFKNTNWNT